MKTIAVIFGSRSAEHDVSIITALSAVIKPLELLKKYKVEAVYIAKDGGWYWGDELKNIALYQSGGIDAFMAKNPKIQLSFDDGLTLIRPGKLGSKQQKIDIVFPATHGTHGEDGELMGLLEMAGVPYVGCGVAASAIAMDKVLSKQIAVANNIDTPKMVFFSKKDFQSESSKWVQLISKSLKLPLFVKPARLGSSIGITKVSSASELENAIEVALHYDSKVLVEEGVENLVEVTLPIIGNEEPLVALLEQPINKDEQFFDFNTKYMNQGKGGKKMGGKSHGSQGYSKIPADLPTELYEKAVVLAQQVYVVVGCEGIARIDMLVDTKAKKVYFNEINPLPGSLYAHNWRQSGISGVDLVERLVALAEQRAESQKNQTTTFESSFLKQF